MTAPNTEIGVCKGTSPDLKYAMTCMQGWRLEMEDDHITMPDFTEDLALFAVFDGHGGSEVSRMAAKLYPSFLKSNEYFKSKDYKRALISSFEKFDLFMMSPEGQKAFQGASAKPPNPGYELCAGSTAIVALIEKNWSKAEEQQHIEVGVRAYKDLDLRHKARDWEAYAKSNEEVMFEEEGAQKGPHKKWRIWIANAGDCRGLLVQSPNRVFALNEEHKPLDKRERRRIEQAGGLVIRMRINENLNLSRALGDFHYKSNFGLPFDEQLIISKPDVYKVVVDTQQPSYLFLGCDGVFEVLSDLEIARQLFKREALPTPDAKETDDQSPDEEPSVVDEIKQVIREEEGEDEAPRNGPEEDAEEGAGEADEGESKSGESLESSSVNKIEDLEVEKKGEQQEGQDGKEQGEDADVKEMVRNMKMILFRTLAPSRQITTGMGYDNMSAICVKLGI